MLDLASSYMHCGGIAFGAELLVLQLLEFFLVNSNFVILHSASVDGAGKIDVGSFSSWHG